MRTVSQSWRIGAALATSALLLSAAATSTHAALMPAEADQAVAPAAATAPDLLHFSGSVFTMVQFEPDWDFIVFGPAEAPDPPVPEDPELSGDPVIMVVGVDCPLEEEIACIMGELPDDTSSSSHLPEPGTLACLAAAAFGLGATPRRSAGWKRHV